MSAKKVLYFLAGSVPTQAEQDDIDALNAQSLKISVMNGSANAEYGVGRNVPCDYVAGTIPDEYSGVDVMDPSDVQVQIATNQVVLTDGDLVQINNSDGSGIYMASFSVIDGVPTVDMPSESYTLMSGDEFVVEGGTVSVVIADAIPTFSFTAAE